MSEIFKLIAAAIAEGRVQRIPAGERGIAPKSKKPDAPTRFHPDHCSKGDRVSRHRFLDEIDGDFA